MKHEHRDSKSRTLPPLNRRSCTPYDAAPTPTFSSISSSEPTPSLKEMAIDLRLVKHSMTEMQDSIRDLFRKVDGVLQRLPAATSNLDASPANDQRGDHDNIHLSQRQQLQVGSSNPSPRRYQIKDIIVNLPFSQRPCDISNVPPSSTQSLVFLPFVTTLQKMQKKSKDASIEVNELDQENQKSDLIFMERTGAKRFKDYIVLAQKFLDIRIDDVEKGEKKWHVFFRKADKPWLIEPRYSVPKWEDQEQEMILFRKVPMTAVERYMPLLEALISTKVVTLAQLHQHKFIQDYKVLMDLDQDQWSQYCYDATKLCWISIRGNSVTQATIKLSQIKAPFYTARFNTHFFPRSVHVVTSKRNTPTKRLAKRSREASVRMSIEENDTKRLRADTPFNSSRARSRR